MDSYNFRDRSQGAGRSDYNIHHKILICSDIRRDVCRNHSEGRSFVYKLGLCTNRHSILFFVEMKTWRVSGEASTRESELVNGFVMTESQLNFFFILYPLSILNPHSHRIYNVNFAVVLHKPVSIFFGSIEIN